MSFALVRFGQALDFAQTTYELRRELKELTAASTHDRAKSVRLATLVSNLGSAVLVEDETRSIEFVNRSFCELFRVPAEPEQLFGLDCAAAAKQSSTLFVDPKGFLERIEAIIASRQPVESEEWAMANGRLVERDYTPILDGDVFRGHVWLYRDVTERRKSDREVERLKNFYEQVLDALPIQLAIFDRELHYLYVTPSAISDPETRAWIVGRTDRELCARQGIGPAIADQRSASLERCIAELCLLSFEESFADRSGTERHYLRIVSPVFDEAGEVIQILGFGLDITERRRAEAALQASEAKLRAIHDATLDALVTINERGEIVDFNPGAVTIFGWDPGQVVGRDVAELIIPEQHREAHRRGMSHYRKTGEDRILGRRLEMTALRADGTEFPCELTVLAIPAAEGETFFTSALRDITEAKAAEASLREAKLEAERLALARQTFLANMSHEIRTPLNAVVGMTHLLASNPDDRDRDSYLAAIRTSAEALFNLINDILDISKVEAGRIEFQRERFRPADVVAATAESMRPAAEGKGLRMSCGVDAELPASVVGDPARLRQILFNLIGNAIKFTEQGEVNVRARLVATEGRRVVLGFEVRDTGIGISLERQAAIFEPFVQEKSSTTKRYGGTGLGLAIVRQLVERQGGQVHLTSAPGLGSRFRVEIPFELPADGVGEQAAVRTPGAAEADDDLTGVKILLVEDNELNQVVASRLLEAAGAHVTVAPSGEDALRRLGAGVFDLVLMDLRMPGLDGFETTARIRQDLLIPGDRLPVVALTASALVEERERALSVGMNDFLMKPFDPVELRRRISVLTRARPESGKVSATEAEMSQVLVDYGQLEAQTLGQRDFALQLIDLFRAQAESFLDDLPGALRREERGRIRALSHRLKSSSAVVGAQILSTRLAELEQKADEPGTRGDLEPLVAAVCDLTAEVIDELARGRARYAPEET